MNKQIFTVGIYLPSDTSRVSKLHLAESIREGYKEHFGQELINLFVMENNVEQNCGTPVGSSKNTEKPLRLSGNIAWENRIEDGDGDIVYGTDEAYRGED